MAQVTFVLPEARAARVYVRRTRCMVPNAIRYRIESQYSATVVRSVVGPYYDENHSITIYHNQPFDTVFDLILSEYIQ